MPEQRSDLILPMLRDIRERIDLVGQQVGVLAQGQVTIRNELHAQGQRTDLLSARIEQLSGHMREVAIAVDAHTNRLDLIEQHLVLDKSKH